MTRILPALNLLVLDEDEAFRESLVRLLRSEKHVAAQAADLASARAQPASTPFDASLADEELPDRGGSDFVFCCTRSRAARSPKTPWLKPQPRGIFILTV